MDATNTTAHDTTATTTEDGLEGPDRNSREWIAGLLMGRPRLLDRFLLFYDRLNRLPRRFRRQIGRKLAAGLAGAALLLAMTGMPTRAAVIDVFNGQVNINDNNKCSLREAIINANDNAQTHDDCAAGGPGLDVISLPNGGNFTVNSSYTNFYGPTGLPVVDSAIIIEGNGSTIVRPNNAPNFRFLGVGESGSLELHDLTLNRGRVANDAGGAIHVFYSPVELHEVTIMNSRATGTGDGGAIANYWGEVLVVGSELVDNVAGDEGGAIFSTIDQFYDTGGEVTVTQSIISGNSADYGGGIAMTEYGYNNDYVYSEWLRIDQSTIADNTADTGGGIFLDRSEGDVLITSSTISGNSATQEGGGIYADFPSTTSVEINNSTISGNSATDGGGIKNEEASFLLQNTTVTGNSASDKGGGLYRYGGGTITVWRSIVSGNTAAIGPNTYSGSGGGISSEYSIFGHSGNAGTYYDYGLDPLDPTDIVPAQSLNQLLNTTLQNAGGFTDVHLLPSESVALDSAPEADCSAAPVSGKDQRGKNRNVNAVNPNNADDCDRGAVERQLFLLPGLWLSALNAGIIDGLSFNTSDILHYDGESWSLFFDGRAAGLPARTSLSAIDIPDPDGNAALMSFASRTKVPGLGNTQNNDIVRFNGDTFDHYFDGSDVRLSGRNEAIDGLDVLPGSASPIGRDCLNYLLISTTGPGNVPGPDGRPLRFEAEDVLGFCMRQGGKTTKGIWHLAVDASAEGAPVGSTTSISAGQANTLYLTAAGDFFVDAAAGRNPSLIYKWQDGRFTGPEVVPAEAGFSGEVAAFDVAE